MVDTTDAHAGSANPYQPPESPPVLAGMSGRFACPKCSESLPFLRLWLLQPLGRCPYCRTRLLVRRHGWHKIWTPALVLVMLWSAFLLAVLIGVRALFFVLPMVLIMATIDGLIAYRVGFFDRPKWFI